MLRLTVFALPTLCLFTSCDKILKVAAAVGKNGSTSENSSSAADQIRISSKSKPEIVAAFDAISRATYEHNRVFLQNVEGHGPVNELAYSAGIGHLDRSARGHSGVAKQIIDAVAATCVYEKGLFVPFDKMRLQVKGMPTWTTDQALQRRGYIQIIDQEVVTYDGAIAYLERGEEPLLQRSFDKQRVPREISGEFLRLRRLRGKEVADSNLGMFREQRSALQCTRDAMTTADPAKANQHIAKANQHEQKAKEHEARMIAEIRKQLSAAGVL